VPKKQVHECVGREDVALEDARNDEFVPLLPELAQSGLTRGRENEASEQVYLSWVKSFTAA